MTTIKTIMARQVHSTTPTAPLADASRIMWQYDVGAVPVVDAKTGTVKGIVTDRDVCMAAYLRGLPLIDIPVYDAMAKSVATCHPNDDVQAVHELMRERQVRRVPVVDEQDALLGIVSLNDLVLDAEQAKGDGPKREVTETMASICKHRPQPKSELLETAGTTSASGALQASMEASAPL